MREGSRPTPTQAQLDAICGECNRQGMRSVVHAFTSAVKMAVEAGCTAIEHGTGGMTDETLALMAAKGTFFDPTVGVVTENYVANKDKYLGVGDYTAEAFAMMEKLIADPKPPEEFIRSLKVPSLKIVYGSDAVAGAHGHNAEGLLYRIKFGGQDPMQALVSATSLAAESLNLGSEIGTIAPVARRLHGVRGVPVQIRRRSGPGQLPLIGSMIVLTREMRVAGTPAALAWLRISSSLCARYTQ
jgi:imidazolonepropionase-like amidohydrolase